MNSVKEKHTDWGPLGSESSGLENLGTSVFTLNFMLIKIQFLSPSLSMPVLPVIMII